MLRHLLFLAFLGITSTGATLIKDIECANKLEAFHECFSGYVWDWTPDNRPDFKERKYCNYYTAAYENCTNIIRDCFPQEEINFWIDNDLSTYMDRMEELYYYRKFNFQKCPAFRLVKTV